MRASSEQGYVHNCGGCSFADRLPGAGTALHQHRATGTSYIGETDFIIELSDRLLLEREYTFRCETTSAESTVLIGHLEHAD